MRAADQVREERGAEWFRLPAAIRGMAAENDGAILLETCRFDEANARSYFFQTPVRVLTAAALSEVPRLFAEIEVALAEGLYVAGYFAYESGYAFEQRLGLPPEQDLPLAWLGVYQQPWVFNHRRGLFEMGPREPEIAPGPEAEQVLERISDHATLGIAETDYRRRILKIQEYIAAGDTYQVNFTDEVSFETEYAAAEVYGALVERQPVAYAALLHVAGRHILSLSPELFFRVEEGKITTRPMKGTMARGLDVAEDREMAVRLANDEKNRSEHLMIVDLLRNDVGRISTMGSVQVENLFSVERYKTLLQMTSTVSGQLREGIGYYEIFRSLFPSGSITGAPKIRTMQIIHELERKPRGVYTGAIGFFAPDRRCLFSVPIRTMVLRDGHAQMGVGGGIVADSDAADEYRECLLKASFLTREAENFELIETMLWEGEIRLLEYHLDRLEESARYFDFACDRELVQEKIALFAKGFATGTRYRVRLLLDADGQLSLENSELSASSEEQDSSVRGMLSEEHTCSTDVYLRHKTTRREFYNRRYAAALAAGFDEVVFTNERGEVTEGAISNIFVEQDGKLLTPPLRCGVLPGVYRRFLIEHGAEERVLRVSDLRQADAIFVSNAVRGLRRVRLH